MSSTLVVLILVDTRLSFHFQIFVYCLPLSKPRDNCYVRDMHFYAALYWWVLAAVYPGGLLRCLKYFCEVEIRKAENFILPAEKSRGQKVSFPVVLTSLPPVTEENKTIRLSSKMDAQQGPTSFHWPRRVVQSLPHFHTWKKKFPRKTIAEVKMSTFNI